LGRQFQDLHTSPPFAYDNDRSGMHFYQGQYTFIE
jgi:hypothetical protein